MDDYQTYILSGSDSQDTGSGGRSTRGSGGGPGCATMLGCFGLIVLVAALLRGCMGG